jgi:hypothetical protein
MQIHINVAKTFNGFNVYWKTLVVSLSFVLYKATCFFENVMVMSRYYLILWCHLLKRKVKCNNLEVSHVIRSVFKNVLTTL